MFDDVIHIDFTREYETVISMETEKTIVRAMDATPSGFVKPDDWVLDMVVDQVCKEAEQS